MTINLTDKTCANLKRQIYVDRVARTHNSGFKKLGVQWLIEHPTTHQYLWWLDSLVLQNPQLLKPANRYASCFETFQI